MKRFPAFAFSLLLAASAFGSDQIREVQTALKSQGFYYGEINGQTTAETTAAIRRYQIRNGLPVTGTLTPQTIEAIAGRSGSPAPKSASPPSVATQPPANSRHAESAAESDRDFLKREEGRDATSDDDAADSRPAPRDPSVLPPPAPMDVADDFPVLFAGTPYAYAPEEVQQRTLRRAQVILAHLGFYREFVDGLPGPATEDALANYQRYTRLIVTGRLDMPTLNRMRLLPQDYRRGSFSPFMREGPPPQRTYRGIWVN